MIRWWRGVGRRRLPVILGLGAFVVGVYVAVVVGGGALIGHTESPSVPLSVLATVAVALLIAPVQSVLERALARRGGTGAATPYEVLSRFSESMSDRDAGEELPVRMAELLTQGTGALWAQVWLTGVDGLTLAASWPPGAADDRSAPDPLDPGRGEPGRRAVAVRHDGRLLGVLRLQERPGLPLTSVEERLFVGLAAQAGLALRLVVLQSHLERRHRELRSRAEELKWSRARLIETQDTERRRLERDIHDGAQQHLVALAVNLRLAQTVAGHAPERASLMLADQVPAARLAMETLASLSRGIYPRLLSEEGLVAALRSAVTSGPIPVAVETDDVERLHPSIEAALFFVCMEAVQNATKHSAARRVTVRMEKLHGTWQLAIQDDGSGFDQGHVAEGAGLVNMRDRLDAVGGRVRVESMPGVGTTVTAVLTADHSDPADPRSPRLRVAG